MKSKTAILLFIITFIISCGLNKSLAPDKKKTQTGYIFNLTIKNNELKFETRDSTYVKISYKNRYDSSDSFTGWTAGQATTNHNYYLPFNNVEYEMKLSAFYKNNNAVFQDTTFTFTSTLSNDNNHLIVHFINVQQGDSMLIQSPDGKNMVIDGGYGTRRNSDWQGSGYPIARQYLVSQNITHLDYIIETHRHEDHWGGLNDILNSNITYGQYISPSQPQGYMAGSRLSLGDFVQFDFFNLGIPDSSFYTGNSSQDENNKSIVLKATHGDVEFLFTGDIDGLIQDWMIGQGFRLSVNVLKVPHHGSSSNNTSDSIFLNQTLNQFAKIAILSFGKNNPYNHPRLLNRFNNFYTYSTNVAINRPTGQNNYHDNCGHIIIYSDGKMVFVNK